MKSYKLIKKPKETIISNFYGCKNVLESLKEIKFPGKFLNIASSEIFGNQKGFKSLNKNSIGIEISNPGHNFNYKKHEADNKKNQRKIPARKSICGHEFLLAVARKPLDPGSVSLEACDIPAPGTKAENPPQADVSVFCAPARN